MSPIEQERRVPLAADRSWVSNSHMVSGDAVSKPSVLIVEDNDDSLFILRSVLLKKGYCVLEAWDGRKAVEIAEAVDLDLILLDLQLPRLNGLGVLHRLRQNAKLQNVPIVVITGHDPETHRGSAIAAGCDDFLLKPIDFDRLDAILDYYAPTQAAA
jgi:two-component system cell cycle response regulator DivK